MMRIALTGHRPDKLGGEYDLNGPFSNAIRSTLVSFIEEWQPDSVISGMALGADMLWAQAALYLGVPLIAAVPFKGQDAKWPPASKKLYKEILSKATEVVEVCEPGYAAWKLQIRNQWMVDDADLVLALWDGSSGGTSNCVKYAEKKGKRLYIINPKDIIARYR